MKEGAIPQTTYIVPSCTVSLEYRGLIDLNLSPHSFHQVAILIEFKDLYNFWWLVLNKQRVQLWRCSHRSLINLSDNHNVSGRACTVGLQCRRGTIRSPSPPTRGGNSSEPTAMAPKLCITERCLAVNSRKRWASRSLTYASFPMWESSATG